MATTRSMSGDYIRVGVIPSGLPFQSGDRLDQPTFHRLYLRTPEGVKAELIGGEVFVASPTSYRHGGPHLRLAGWLDQYAGATPGTTGYDNTTNVLGPESQPEPDLCLVVDAPSGGQTRKKKGLLIGSPELVVEVAHSSVAIDLGKKKADYERAGVLEYVVALVEEQRVRWFVNSGGRFEEMMPVVGLHRSRVFPGLWLDPAGVFTKSRRRLDAALRKGLTSPEHMAFVAALKAKRSSVQPKTNGKRGGAK